MKRDPADGDADEVAAQIGECGAYTPSGCTRQQRIVRFTVSVQMSAVKLAFGRSMAHSPLPAVRPMLSNSMLMDMIPTTPP